ncbi:MAG TPA: hypothetical protein VHE34_09425 [Puia sp.]|uniref:hypothetical protein n=1 Tax=Puia sp. TaxID=2045100 RepID=UPI002D19D843|nr:hypothetical protein [Puia sp.]HVU95434.1 hypothetical protein [Puia sp.]
MNNDQNLQHLALCRLEYSIDQVNYWLGQQGMAYFVFDEYFPATQDPNRPIYLCCFAQNDEGGYFNAYNPDLLAPYPGQVLMQAGPLKLTGSVVSVDQMLSILPPGSNNNYLLFTPVVDPHGQIYYSIQPFYRTATGDVLGSGSINTNPSPPATSMVASEME